MLCIILKFKLPINIFSRACCMIYKDRSELYEIEDEKRRRPVTQYDTGLRPKFRSIDREKRSFSLPPRTPPISIVKPIMSEKSSTPPKQEKKPKQDKMMVFKPVPPLKTIKELDKEQEASRNIREIGPTVLLLQENSGEAYNRFKRGGDRLARFKPRTNLFQNIQVQPYNTSIKPLDRQFKIRSHSQERPIFQGYLP